MDIKVLRLTTQDSALGAKMKSLDMVWGHEL